MTSNSQAQTTGRRLVHGHQLNRFLAIRQAFGGYRLDPATQTKGPAHWWIVERVLCANSSCISHTAPPGGCSRPFPTRAEAFAYARSLLPAIREALAGSLPSTDRDAWAHIAREEIKRSAAEYSDWLSIPGDQEEREFIHCSFFVATFGSSHSGHCVRKAVNIRALSFAARILAAGCDGIARRGGKMIIKPQLPMSIHYAASSNWQMLDPEVSRVFGLDEREYPQFNSWDEWRPFRPSEETPEEYFEALAARILAMGYIPVHRSRTTQQDRAEAALFGGAW